MYTKTSYEIVKVRFYEEDIFSKSESEKIRKICEEIDEVVDPELCRGYLIDFDENSRIIYLSAITDNITIEKENSFWNVCNMVDKINIRPFCLDDDEVDYEDEPHQWIEIEFSFRM